MGAHPSEPAKKQSKWSAEEDVLVIELRGSGMKWEDISENIPGRSSISCRLHYQNYLERRCEWDEERINKLARLYERYVMIPFTLIMERRLEAGEGVLVRKRRSVGYDVLANQLQIDSSQRCGQRLQKKWSCRGEPWKRCTGKLASWKWHGAPGWYRLPLQTSTRIMSPGVEGASRREDMPARGQGASLKA